MCCKLQSANVYRRLASYDITPYLYSKTETTDKKELVSGYSKSALRNASLVGKKSGIRLKCLSLVPDFTTHSRGAWAEPSLTYVNLCEKKYQSIHPSTVYGVVLAPTSGQKQYKPISKQVRRLHVAGPKQAFLSYKRSKHKSGSL